MLSPKEIVRNFRRISPPEQLMDSFEQNPLCDYIDNSLSGTSYA
jgi:hypothetical protein